MPRGRKRKPGPRHPGGQIVRDRILPTPETKAKLTDDPLWPIVQPNSALQDAAEEIGKIWFALTKQLFSKGMTYERREAGKAAEMPEGLAWAHAHVYVPWSLHWGRVAGEVIDIVVDRQPVAEPERVRDALRDYARRRWHT